jgi:hypothetical protein
VSETLDEVLGAAEGILGENTSTALVKGVCDRLRALVAPGLHVEEFPDEVEEYQLRHQVGAYLVRYAGATYTKPESTDVIVQRRRILVDVIVVTRKLNGPSGTMAWLEVARLALAGYELPGFERLVPQAERFEGRNANQWAYAITFGAPTMAVELGEEEVGPAIERIILAHERENLEVSSG